jgi:hypothetical protein
VEPGDLLEPLSGPELDRLRTEGGDLAQTEAWADLVRLGPRLRADREWWPLLWAPAVAVGLGRTGDRPGGFALLREAADAGFRQPEMFGELLEATFGADPSWPDLSRLLHGPAPEPAVSLTEWPSVPPSCPLVLERQPGGREEELAALLPAPSRSAWGTARATLEWVHTRWRHANAHIETHDALAVLAGVDAGQRFACVEYTTVLTESLNALHIPARRVELFQRDHHVGLGRGHVVSEAWIDDLGRWVLLDGQNGAWWTDPDGAPLSTQTLIAEFDGTAAGARRWTAVMVGPDGRLPEADAEGWGSYFFAGIVTGIACSPQPFIPVFQGSTVRVTPRLVRDPDLVEPDLSGIETAVVDAGGPAVRLTPVHPFAVGLTVTDRSGARDVDGPEPTIPLDGIAGEHELEVSTRTPYGALAAHRLAYTRR